MNTQKQNSASESVSNFLISNNKIASIGLAHHHSDKKTPSSMHCYVNNLQCPAPRSHRVLIKVC